MNPHDGLGLAFLLGLFLGYALHVLQPRRKSGLPAARGRALDRIALDRFDMEREGWREKLPIFGDDAFRARLRRASAASPWSRGGAS